MPKKKRSLTSPLRNNPNATIGGGSAGAAAFVVYLAGLAGLELTPEGAALIVGAVSTLVLALGKRRPAA